uniref:transducin beta-like protein 3 n=1 Tax=Styela clava TaxID=7725 RepID=UPI0019396D33|nr:transducin beta-like protein 3 [Styela clava]
MDSKLSGKLLLKTNFAVKHKWEPFYTGGSVVCHNDGKTLLCSCGDSVKVIDIETGEVNHSLSQEGDDVTCISSSPDNNIIVSATRSLLLKEWKIENEVAKCVRTWKAIHTSPILCMDFDATSTLLATGSSDSTIKIWDMLHQYCTHNLRGSQGVISVVKFHPHDLQLFSASNDYVIRIWNLHTSRCICLLNGHVSAVTSLSFITKTESQISLISGGRDSVLCVWDLLQCKDKNTVEPNKTIPVYETIEGLLVLPNQHITKLIKTAISDESSHVLTAGSSGNLRVWNLSTGKCIYTQKRLTETEETKSDSEHGAIVDLLYLENIEKYATVTFDHNINIFNYDDGFVEDRHLVGYNDEVLDVRFFGPSDSHIVVATNSPLVKVFDRKTSSCQLLSGHRDTVLCLDVFKDGLMLASGSKDNSIRLWRMNPETFKTTCIAVGRGHAHAVNTVSCSRIKQNFVVSGSQDQTLKIWAILETVDEDGKQLTSLKSKHSIKAHDKDINSVSVSPNDKLVATGSQDKTAKLWNVADGLQLGTFHGHKRGIWSTQFSSTDQVLGTSSADGTLKLWALSDFTCLKTFEGHDCSVLKLLFISKGSQIVSSGSNGLIKLWNIKSSECVKTFDEHDDKVWGLTVNSGDNIVLSGAADSKIIQWEDITQKEREELKVTEETTILRQQELNNLVHEKRFAKAFRLAITLEQPFTALKVLKEIRWEENGDEVLEATISKLRPDQKDTLLKFVMSWNTNSRNCHEAQKVLNLILRQTHPHELMEFSNAQTAIEALLPYTERHYQRMTRLMQQTTFVDYIWQIMKLKPVSLPDTNEIIETNAELNKTLKEANQSSSHIHPLKAVADSIVQKPQKRTRKPDNKDDGIGDKSETEEEDKQEIIPIISPKRMRLRSAKKSKKMRNPSTKTASS